MQDVNSSAQFMILLRTKNIYLRIFFNNPCLALIMDYVFKLYRGENVDRIQILHQIIPFSICKLPTMKSKQLGLKADILTSHNVEYDPHIIHV